MRDFGVTPEPSGSARIHPAASDKKRRRFVVQMHRASHLHYDFRLEASGVLLSWAIPKGPSMSPSDRRLAMQTEDHPLDYYDFEGSIPAGNYGAGEVIVWDWGTYELVEGDSPYEQAMSGKMKIRLFGEKLHGVFTLVKMHARNERDNRAWILIKDKYDGEAENDWDVQAHTQSVKTGQSLDDIASDPNAKTWQSNRKTVTKARPMAARELRDRVRDEVQKAERRSAGKRAAPKRKTEKMAFPAVKTPELATLIDSPFDDDDWLFEIKWDGIRALVAVDASGDVTITSRNGKNLEARFPELKNIARSFTERPILVDGEVVAIDEDGRSSFQRLQRSRSQSESIRYVVFDALFADGRDLRGRPLDERKGVLESIVRPNDPLVVYSQHVVGEGKKLYAVARERNLEGIIGKRRDSKYVEKRTKDWVKIKVTLAQECVIGGFTDPQGSRAGFGALILGVHDGAHDGSEGRKLRYVGHVGTGFNSKLLASLYAKLVKLEVEQSPFGERIPRRGSDIHWVKPKLVAQVSFTEWTDDGRMRHPTFEGLREDKPASDIIRERAEPTRKAIESTKSKR